MPIYFQEKLHPLPMDGSCLFLKFLDCKYSIFCVNKTEYAWYRVVLSCMGQYVIHMMHVSTKYQR